MEDGELATRQATMVDDIRVGVRERNHLDARAPCRQIKAGMNSLGNQASDRKYQQPSTRAGAWNSSIITTHTPFPRKPTTAKKWVKLKEGLNWLCFPE